MTVLDLEERRISGTATASVIDAAQFVRDGVLLAPLELTIKLTWTLDAGRLRSARLLCAVVGEDGTPTRNSVFVENFEDFPPALRAVVDDYQVVL